MKELRSKANKPEDATRRVLRRRRRPSHNQCSICKTRSQLQRRQQSSSDNSLARKTSESLIKTQRRQRSNSASTLDSVVFLGQQRKMPQVVVLEDSSSDEEKRPVSRRKFRKLRSSKSRKIERSETAPKTNHTYEADLLCQLQEMHVDSTLRNESFNSDSSEYPREDF